MPTSQTRTSARPSTTPSRAKHETTTDPIELLGADHKKVQKMFKEFEKLKEDDREAAVELVGNILTELTIHAQLEEEIFYPSLREAAGEEAASLLDEAEVEHASAKDLISQIAAMSPDDDLYDAKVTVLGEYVKHHIKEEEREIFPKAKKSDLDMAELGSMMADRKTELTDEMGVARA